MTDMDAQSDPDNEPVATTAGDEDHSDIDNFRGEAANAPADTGRPAAEGPS